MTKFSKLVILTICAMLLMTNVLIKAEDDCKSKITNCETCDTTTPTKCTKCQDGFYPNDPSAITKCTACSTGCTKCSDKDTCTACADTFKLVGSTCVSQDKCKIDVPNCATCDATTPTKCTKCQDGFYPNDPSAITKCTACSTGCTKCSDKDTCTACADTYTHVGSTCVSNKKCLETVANCTSCDKTTPTKCTACADKYTLNATGFCEKNGSKDLTTYSITYFMTFACLLITLAFVASFA